MLEEQDAVCGHVEVRCWSGLHGRVVRGPGKGVGRGRGPTQPLVTGWVVRIILDRAPGQARPLKPLRLWYAGPAPPAPAARGFAHQTRHPAGVSLDAPRRTPPMPTSHWLDVPGARLYYETRGAGPLLMLIGHPMDSAGFAP